MYDNDVEDSALWLLTRAYFNEDWGGSEPDESDVVRDFATHESREDVGRLQREIRAVLDGPATEDDLREIWSVRNRAQFNPSRSGLTYRQWFERILEILDA